MKKIGIVYPSTRIGALLPNQTEAEKATQGLLIGLVFSPVSNDPSPEIIGLNVYQVFYKPDNNISRTLGSKN